MAISSEVRAAIESAGTVGHNRQRNSFDFVRSVVLAVVRELPDDMSLAELRDELEISENQ